MSVIRLAVWSGIENASAHQTWLMTISMPVVSRYESYVNIGSVISIYQPMLEKHYRLIGTLAKSHIGASLF